MSIFDKLNTMDAVVATKARTPMSKEQQAKCKEHIRAKRLGYCVHPNQWDIAKPYRIAINYNDEWSNFGDFASADVAAAIGSIVSLGFFGKNGKLGAFDQAVVEADPVYQTWMKDSRNETIIARAEGNMPTVHVYKDEVSTVEDADLPF